MSNRISETVAKTPPATVGIVAICVGVYALQVAMDLDLELFTMCPRLVIYVHEYYRIVTSALFHGNLMHIGMNLMSTFHLSTHLEQRLGTIPHLISTLGAILLTSLVYISISWAASVLGYDEWMYQHSVGFSGVLFHFCVLECNLASNTSRSLFGVLHVPTYVYPWALLVLLQMFMPNLSFLGHLSGILTGYCQYYGIMDIMNVGPELDSWSVCSWLVQRSSFVAAPSNDNHRTFQEPSALVHSIRGGCRTICTFFGHLLETFSVCIFGRGRRWNANIRLPQWTTMAITSTASSSTSEGHVLGSSLEEDEEWVVCLRWLRWRRNHSPVGLFECKYNELHYRMHGLNQNDKWFVTRNFDGSKHDFNLKEFGPALGCSATGLGWAWIPLNCYSSRIRAVIVTWTP